MRRALARELAAAIAGAQLLFLGDANGEESGESGSYATPRSETREGRPGQLCPAALLRCDGDYWTLTYAGFTARIRDLKGLHYLAQLVQCPGQEAHVLDLVRRTPAAGAPSAVEARHTLNGSRGPLLDAGAKAAYRRRLLELRDQLEEADRFNDTGRAEQAREEIGALTAQLAAATGLGGRDRPNGTAAERARLAVTKRVRMAIERIARRHPGLADHLAARVRTGLFCVYHPDPERPIAWDVG
jgi:hypothetical protein